MAAFTTTTQSTASTVCTSVVYHVASTRLCVLECVDTSVVYHVASTRLCVLECVDVSHHKPHFSSTLCLYFLSITFSVLFYLSPYFTRYLFTLISFFLFFPLFLCHRVLCVTVSIKWVFYYSEPRVTIRN